MLIYLDLETRSLADLPTVGGDNYAADASSEILLGCALAEDGRLWLWSPHPGPLDAAEVARGWADLLDDVLPQPPSLGSADLPPDLAAFVPAARLVAHNAEGFDRLVWEGLDYPAPAAWLDSYPRALRACLPGRLNDLGAYVLGAQKDASGPRLIRLYSVPNSHAEKAAVKALEAAEREFKRELAKVEKARAKALKRGEPLPPLPQRPERDPSLLDEDEVPTVAEPRLLTPAVCRRCAPLPSPVPDCPACRAGVRSPFVNPAHDALTALARYCARDVALLACVWLAEGLGEPHEDDAALELDARVNRRGVALDRELLRRLALVEGSLTLAAEERAAAALGTPNVAEAATTLRSPSALLAWLHHEHAAWASGAAAQLAPDDEDGDEEPGERRIADTRAGTVDALLALDPPPTARVVLEARRDVARVTAGKLAAALRRVGSDGRLRHVLAYYGAHTGRWAGRGVQPQNLPRCPEGLDGAAVAEALLALPCSEAGGSTAEVAALRAVVEEAARAATAAGSDLSPADALGALLRSAFVAADGRVLLAVDFASVEARGLLWLAGDEAGLDVYRRGEDPYKAAASAIYGVPYAGVTKAQRAAGKVSVLSGGFGGGSEAIARFAAKEGIDLTAAGTTPEAVVEGWRDSRPLVAGRRSGRWQTPEGRWITQRQGGLWRDTYAAAVAVARGEVAEAYAGRCLWSRRGADLLCRLPSGRALRYREAYMERLPSRWDPSRLEERLTFRRPHGRAQTYGGRLAENCWAAGTLVLTPGGPRPIEAFRPDDLVWDGERWASCDGARASPAPQEVGEWLGTVVTRDHRVLAGRRWTQVGDLDPVACARARVRGSRDAPTSWVLRGSKSAPLRGLPDRVLSEVLSELSEVWSPLGRREVVYDLLNCGPRHRYTVLTAAGPVIAHNCTQAVCRDLLAQAMLRLDAASYEIVLHVHDEVVVELPDPGARAEVEAIVSAVPPWARGFPLAVSGALGRRYAK